MLPYDDRSDASLARYEGAEAELNEIVEDTVDQATRTRPVRSWTPRRPTRSRPPAPPGGRRPPRPRPDLQLLANRAAAHIRIALRDEPAMGTPLLTRAEALVARMIQILQGLVNEVPSSTAHSIKSLVRRLDAERRAIRHARLRLGPMDFDGLRRSAERIATLAKMAAGLIAAAPRATYRTASGCSRRWNDRRVASG